MVQRTKKKRLVVGLSVSLAVLIPFFVHSLYLGRSNLRDVASLCADHTCACEDWYRRSAGEYQIENNVWNKGNTHAYEQCVFLEEYPGGFEAGWAWNWPGIRFDVRAYPNIIYGKNPWLPSTSPNLPVRIGDLGCLEAQLDVAQQGSGKGNLAFDLWLTSSPAAQPSDITREIMIWLSRDGFFSAGLPVDTMEIDGHPMRLWKKENHNPSEDYRWTYLAFVLKSDLTQGSLNLSEFLNYLVENKHISPDEYLAAIQLGNEIVSGFGRTLIRGYQIRSCD
jgi:hypothetical protein